MASSTVDRLRIERRPEFAKILRADDSFGSGTSRRRGNDRGSGDGVSVERVSVERAGGVRDWINTFFDRLVAQSGVELQPGVILRLCILSAVTVGGTIFVVGENLLATAGGVLAGSLVPIAALAIARKRRQMQIDRQMPAMIGRLAESLRTGRSLEECLDLIAADTPRPLGAELAFAVRRLELGLGVEAAFADVPERTGLDSVRDFVTALVTSDRTGADLIALLDRTLARAARDE